MKKKLNFILFLIFIVIMTNINIVNAKSTDITASTNATVDSGGEITVTIKSSVSLSGYTISVTSSGEASFKSVSAPNGVNANSNGSKIGGTLSSGGTQTLATYKFSAPTVTEDKKITINFKASGLLSADDDELDPVNNITATITVKAPVQTTPVPTTPTPTTPENPKPQTKPTELEFTAVNNKTVYLTTKTNFRSTCSVNEKNIIHSLDAGTKLIQIGKSKTKVDNYIWSKVIYTNEAGKNETGYVINNNLTTTKPAEAPKTETPVEEPQVEEPAEDPQEISNIDEEGGITTGLKSLEVEGQILSPSFKPNVYEYRVVVRENISDLNINATSYSEDATITIAGNTNLQEGENLITIIVYNGGQVEGTYQITVNKNTLDLAETDAILMEGTKSATKAMIIYVAIFSISFVALIVALILKHRYQKNKQNEDEENVFPGDNNEPGYIIDPNYSAPNDINQDYTMQNDIEQNYEEQNNIEQDYQEQNNIEENYEEQSNIEQAYQEQNNIEQNYQQPNDLEPNADIDKREKRKGKHF